MQSSTIQVPCYSHVPEGIKGGTSSLAGRQAVRTDRYCSGSKCHGHTFVPLGGTASSLVSIRRIALLIALLKEELQRPLQNIPDLDTKIPAEIYHRKDDGTQDSEVNVCPLVRLRLFMVCLTVAFVVGVELYIRRML
jgi:hypothetical protein